MDFSKPSKFLNEIRARLDEKKSQIIEDQRVNLYEAKRGFTGFVTDRINGLEVIEGSGPYGGEWAVKDKRPGPDKGKIVAKCKSREEAKTEAEVIADNS